MTSKEIFLNLIKSGELEIGEGANTDLIGDFLSTTSSMVNNFSFAPETMIPLILENEKADIFMLRTSILWIKFLSQLHDMRFYDERNQHSVLVCKEMSLSKEFDDLYSLLIKENDLIEKEYSHSDVKKFAEIGLYSPEILLTMYMSTDHRTLIQTFSKLIFMYLDTCSHQKVVDMILKLKNQNRLSEYFQYTPLI